MKRVGLLAALAAGAATAQGVPPMYLAVSQSMQRVCAVDVNSRACEVLQDLFAQEVEVMQGRAKAPAPQETRAEFREALRRAVNEGTDRTQRPAAR